MAHDAERLEYVRDLFVTLDDHRGAKYHGGSRTVAHMMGIVPYDPQASITMQPDITMVIHDVRDQHVPSSGDEYYRAQAEVIHQRAMQFVTRKETFEDLSGAVFEVALWRDPQDASLHALLRDRLDCTTEQAWASGHRWQLAARGEYVAGSMQARVRARRMRA